MAIAIALANTPALLLADEPTGSVDAATSAHLLDVFRHVNQNLGTTVVIVTHDRQIARKVSRVVTIRDGKAASEMIATRESLEESSFAGRMSQEFTHEEYSVLDRAGRVQIPADYLERLHVKGNKVKIEYVDSRLIISAPDGDNAVNKSTTQNPRKES